MSEYAGSESVLKSVSEAVGSTADGWSRSEMEKETFAPVSGKAHAGRFGTFWDHHVAIRPLGTARAFLEYEAGVEKARASWQESQVALESFKAEALALGVEGMSEGAVARRRVEDVLPPREVVALGFIMKGHVHVERYRVHTQEPHVVWVELENTAPIESRQFAVSGENVQKVLTEIRDEYSSRDMMYSFLWHSHFRTQSPSELDVEQFPAWLVDWACVSHIPTGSLCAYNGYGEILSVTDGSRHTTDG